MIGRVLTQHQAFEVANPDEAEIQKAYEAYRQAVHRAKHGSLAGYKARREFPCKGFLTVVDQMQTMLIVECDTCGFLTTCRREQSPLSTAVQTTGADW